MTTTPPVSQAYKCCPFCFHVYDPLALPPCPECGSSDAPTAMHSKLGRDDQARMLADVQRHGEHRAALSNRWIVSLEASVQRLTAHQEISDADVVMFWLKLHGALVDLPDAFSGVAWAFSEAPQLLVTLQQTDPYRASIITAALAVRESARRLPTALDRDELIYVEWSRNREAHLYQNAYELRLSGKGTKLKDAFDVKVLGAPVSVADQWAAIGRVYARCGRSDLGVAVACARKVRANVQDLALRQAHYHTLASVPIVS